MKRPHRTTAPPPALAAKRVRVGAAEPAVDPVAEPVAPPKDDGVLAGGAGRELGHQIRDLRRARRVTIPTLAARIQRSVGWVSQIERGMSEVTIASLHQIADVLGVQVSWFFQPGVAAQERERGLVLRKSQRRQLDFHGSGVHEEILSPTVSGPLLLVESTFAPGASTGDRDRERRGDEAGLVLEGTLELTVEGQVLTLNAGDSFAFSRKGPHRCKNPGKRPAVVLWVIAPASY